jgi:uncharacterized protein YjbJ (UPF0337 family)
MQGGRGHRLCANAEKQTERGGKIVNWDQIKGNWKQFKGKARQKWGKLTDDELDMMEGKREELIGKVQEKYGITREQAEKDVNEFGTSL